MCIRDSHNAFIEKFKYVLLHILCGGDKMPYRDGTGYDGTLKNCMPVNDYNRPMPFPRPRWGLCYRPQLRLGRGRRRRGR